MITLKTLHEASLQQIFEQCANHLLKQNKKCATNGDGFCKYRLNDLKCAAGCFISDDEYREHFEGKSFTESVFQKYYPLIQDEKYIIIYRLQRVHDDYNIFEWKNKLIELGIREKLNVEFLQ